MADARPFRGLRYIALTDLSLAIAPPYDVISPAEQQALYDRSPYNVVRIEYGLQRDSDTESDDRYSRAAADLAQWRADGVLAIDERSSIYGYRQQFAWGGAAHSRQAYFVALRLEEWEKGVVKPHEHTLAKPKADRLRLLRATRAQISPVYGLFRGRPSVAGAIAGDETLFDCEAADQRHTLSAITDGRAIASFIEALAEADVYIADGHHRYETALAYRDEVRAAAASWTGEEPENFVLTALTQADDPGLLVLPTHRLVHRQAPADALSRLEKRFEVQAFPMSSIAGLIESLGTYRETSFVAVGLGAQKAHVLTVRDRSGVEALMPQDQPDAWRKLDVNVLQYGVLLDVLGIDDGALKAGSAVTYTQDPVEAVGAVASGAAQCALFINATPVDQVLAIADAGGRMPQKSTYFYPKLPTGLVMRALG